MAVNQLDTITLFGSNWDNSKTPLCCPYVELLCTPQPFDWFTLVLLVITRINADSIPQNIRGLRSSRMYCGAEPSLVDQ
jgi:hypothetical protein